MKKYIICFFSLAAVLGVSYGYYKGYDHLRLSSQEQKYIEDNAQVVTADDTTNTKTKLVLETYNEVSKKLDKEMVNLPVDYMGMTRVQLVEALDTYMENVPLKEYEQGLVSYDLLYFSKDYVMMRKTYHPEEDFQKYYVKFNKGSINVYYSDKKTVYEYTDIRLEDLPLELQTKVITGMNVKDEKALYDFLENYSS